MPPKAKISSKRKPGPPLESRKKKAKKPDNSESDDNKSPPAELGKELKDDGGNSYWEIGGRLRRITLSEFNGKTLVSVREYYEKDGKTLPGKKGISLTVEQLNMFISILPQLDVKLRDKDIELSRPSYVQKSHAQGKSKRQKEEESDEDVRDESDDEVKAKSEEE